MKEYTTHSEYETLNIGKKLGELLNVGDIVCLNGDLGTGKTVFVKGIAMALSIDEYITSPTFTIVNEYDSKIPLFHFDVYRISDSDEMFEIGFEEYLDNKGIVVIEWASIISEILPEETINVTISKVGEDFDLRNIIIDFNGEKYKDLEQKFEGELR